MKHEHLPVGMGDIDYKKVFTEYLRDFDGRIILEIVEDDKTVVNSKKIILEAINSRI